MSNACRFEEFFGNLPSTNDNNVIRILKKRAKEVQKSLQQDGLTVKLSEIHQAVANKLGYRSWQALVATVSNTCGPLRGTAQVFPSGAPASQAPIAVVPQIITTEEPPPPIAKKEECLRVSRLDPLDEYLDQLDAAEAAADALFEQQELERMEAEAAADAFFEQQEMERLEAEAAADAFFEQQEMERLEAEAAADAFFEQQEMERLKAEAAADAFFEQQ